MRHCYIGWRVAASITVAVLGAGIAGLAATIAFARAGHKVILIERDSAPPPTSPGLTFLHWDRPGVPQRRLLHGFVPLARLALRAHLPDLVERLHSVGANDVDLLDPLQNREHRAGDEDLLILRCRRTVFEWILRQAAGEDPRVTVRVGTVATSLVGTPGGPGRMPRVTGVRLRSGGIVDADLVIDATGRSSPALRWLADLSSVAPEESRQPCGLIYYSRFYERPQPGFPTGFRGHLGYGLVSASAADGRTFDITIFARAEVPGLRRLRDADAFERAVGSIEGLQPWREGARPLGPVATMGALENRLRRFVVGGRPLVTGFILIGDSLSHTNPTLGRGMALALDQAFRAARIDWSKSDLEGCASAYHSEVDSMAGASYADAAEADIVAAQVYAGVEGAAKHARATMTRAIQLAAAADHDLYRASVRHAGLLDPPGSLYVEPWISRAQALVAAAPAARAPGPDLERMLKLLQR